MNKEKLEQLLEKTDLIRFMWEEVNGVWTVNQLTERAQRVIEAAYILGEGHTKYNMDKGVFLYQLVDDEYKLIAVIKGDTINETIK